MLSFICFRCYKWYIECKYEYSRSNRRKTFQKRMMSGMHALWSVGCFAGAGLFSILAKLGLGISQIAIIHCIIIS